jgi:hypothetical protein
MRHHLLLPEGVAVKILRPSALVVLLVMSISLFSLPGCGGGPDPSMELGGINTGEVLDGLLARTQRAMSLVNGVDGAKKANAELLRVNEDYDDLLFHLPKLSDEGRAALAKKSSRALPEMRALASRIHEMPALDDILGVTLDQMVAKLEMVR